ncbi:DUF6174 domain-containing protein [Streptomyces sp. NPDC093544]|jgi:hypothetical protein|uniref:DUF6174 domain-containing protein n=1 Tax=Streptomyces sp. NPDC093544 TaxID=3155200 RepID=UPI00341D3A49
MTAPRITSRSLPAAALIGALLYATAACGSEASTSSGSGGKAAANPSTERSTTSWEEPASYVYTMTSSEGERSLIGTFRVTVLDGKVTAAVGLDDSGRQVVEHSLSEVPTIGGLLAELERARRDNADKAEAEYAPDGHPVRISLDWESNAIDDEALYVISAYEPSDG